MIDLNSFLDELRLIKEAEEEPKSLDVKKLFKQLALNAAAYGVGAGAGAGLGYLGAEKLLPKRFSKVPAVKWGVTGIAGALTGLGALATWEALRLARKEENKRAAE